jgi:hypothetical protein
MVRNAIRIVCLTIFKLNDESVNRLLGDLPFVSYFAHLACLYRDKLLDLDRSYQVKQVPVQSFEPLYASVEEMQDMMDYFQEVYDCDNRAVSDLLTNALLHYCYLPVVLGSLATENRPILSISTAQFILIQTFARFRYQPLVNTLVGALLLERIPRSIKKAIEHYPESDPVSYKFKWMLKLPVHTSLSQCKNTDYY